MKKTLFHCIIQSTKIKNKMKTRYKILPDNIESSFMHIYTIQDICMGEGNGNRLQCSCLENPRDGAWWAAIYGVTQSRTRLK